MAKVHDQGARGDADGRSAATAEDVVVTETPKVAGTEEMNVTLAGTEQFAPLGVGDMEQALRIHEPRADGVDVDLMRRHL